MCGSLPFFQFERILTTFRAKKVMTRTPVFDIIDTQVELKPETVAIGSGNAPARVQLLWFSRAFFEKNRLSQKENIKVAAARPVTLQDRVLQIDHIQARRYTKLAGESLEMATEGIIRHLRACARMDVNPDASAVREIIDDAINGRRVFAETSNDLLAA